MRIVVCIKQVPATNDASIDPETKRIVREGVKAILNPFDTYAIEEGVLDPRRTIQIGLRGSMYDLDDFEWGEKMGVRLVRIEEAMAKGPEAIMAEARQIVGGDPVYVSFDIDMLDPAYAPGTGTPEVGGFTTFQAQQMLRELRGLNIVGADVVEVSPSFDPSGITAHAGVTMMFEILCSMAEDVAKRRRM